MSRDRLDDRTIDALAAIARDAPVPPIRNAQRDAQIERAMREAEDAPIELPRRRLGAQPVAWALAAAAVIALTVLATRSITAPADAGPGELVLATGDRVTTAPHTAITLDEVTPDARAVVVRAGEALFDVAPLGAGESFVVRTPELEVSVRGTVFAVERTGERTTVRVYEGRVEVRERGDVTQLAPGERYRSGEGRARDVGEGALEEVGRAAAERRAQSPVAVARSVPPHAPAEVAPARARSSASAEVAPEPALAGRPTAPVRAAPAVSSAPSPSVGGRTAPPPAVAVAPSPAPSATPSDTPQTDAPARPDLAPTATEVQALLVSRRFEDALDAARRGRARAPSDWRFGMLEAQALQGLGRHADAADAFDTLARTAPATERPEAAFRAATLRWRDLGQPRRAVESLERVDFTGSALQERALGLRARALADAGDAGRAASVAREYLARYPQGGLADTMRALVER